MLPESLTTHASMWSLPCGRKCSEGFEGLDPDNIEHLRVTEPHTCLAHLGTLKGCWVQIPTGSLTPRCRTHHADVVGEAEREVVGRGAEHLELQVPVVAGQRAPRDGVGAVLERAAALTPRRPQHAALRLTAPAQRNRLHRPRRL